MSGGLLQLAAIGKKDVFFTFNPQITFFKSVFKRHSNFAMEYVEEQFFGTQNFGENLFCNLSKAGDLLFRIYLKITLPQVALSKSIVGASDINSSIYNTILDNYNKLQRFINIVNYNVVNPLTNLINKQNLTINELHNSYGNIKNHADYTNELQKINLQFTFFNTFRLPLQILTETEAPLNPSIVYNNININMQSILDFDSYYQYTFNPQFAGSVSDVLQTFLTTYLLHLKIIKTNLYSSLSFYKTANQKITRENINFAWVQNIGHQIIDSISISIGNKIIDSTDAIRLDIYRQLTNKILQNQTYDELIGNISELTNYDSTTKPEYTLFVPLNFWFNKYSGIALPTIALNYHDITINLKLNDLIKCCYFEHLKTNISIENYIQLSSVSLICNYIYIGSDERTKFANGHHEYLIDQQLQYDNLINQSQNEIISELGFFHPCKQMYWICRTQNNLERLKYFEYSTTYYTDIYSFENTTGDQQVTNTNLIKFITVDKYITNNIAVGDIIEICNSIYYSGIYKIKYIYNNYIYIEYPTYFIENYSYNYNNILHEFTKTNNFIANSQAYIKKINDNNPIISSQFIINGKDRFPVKTHWKYFNYIQPFVSNTQTPQTGINTYSFAIRPEDYQPSGFINFNRIEISKLQLTMDNNFSQYNLLNIFMFIHNYNILRIEYGKAGLVLNI